MDRQRMNLVLAASWAAQFPKTADHADIDLSPIIGVSPELFETQQGSDDFPDPDQSGGEFLCICDDQCERSRL